MTTPADASTPYPGSTLWPSNFQKCTLTGRYVTLAGEAAKGTIIISASPDALLDAAAKAIILPVDLQVELDENGAFSIDLPATDDPDITPTAWTYRITEKVPHGRAYSIEAPMGTTVDLAEAAPVPTAAGKAITKGDPGQQGDPGPAGPAGASSSVFTDYTSRSAVGDMADTGQEITTSGQPFDFVGNGMTLSRGDGTAPVAGYIYRKGPSEGIGSIRMRFRFNTSAPNVGKSTLTSSVALIAWDKAWDGSLPLPSAACHVTLAPTTWGIYVVDPNAPAGQQIVLVSQGSWVTAFDTDQEAYVSIIGDTTRLVMPDGTVHEATDSRFATLSTQYAVTEIYAGQPQTDVLPTILSDEFVSAAVVRSATIAAAAAIPATPTTPVTTVAAARPASPLRGVPLTDNCFVLASPLAQTTTGTSRTPHTVMLAGTDLRFVYSNWYNQGSSGTPQDADTDNTAAITVKAAVELNGVRYPLSFGGKAAVAIDGGCWVESDPLPMDVAAGQVIYAITEITPTTSWYPNRVSQFTSGTGGWTTTTGLTVMGGAAIPDTSPSQLYGPSQITGRVLPALGDTSTPKVAAIVGDSLAAGSNDYSSGYVGRDIGNPQRSGGGYLQRACYDARVPVINTAQSGDQAFFFLNNSNRGHYRRITWVSAASTALVEYGRNDVSNSRTLPQVQADLITIWTMLAKRGLRVLQGTITPLTSSTDGFVTTTNQTITNATQHTVRVNLNNWLRDGAPLTSKASLTPVATGTAGALRAGDPSHPLYDFWDAADAAESARDSGIWRVFPGRVVNDVSMGASAANVNSPTAAFTSADLGSTMVVAGAGPSGGPLIAIVLTVNSATSVTVSATSAAAVSGAKASIDVASTKDGLHPSRQLAIAMAATVSPAKFA